MYNNKIKHTTNEIFKIIDNITDIVSKSNPRNIRNINLSYDKHSSEKMFNLKNNPVDITLQNRRYNNNIFDEDTDIKSMIKQELINLNFSLDKRINSIEERTNMLINYCLNNKSNNLFMRKEKINKVYDFEIVNYLSDIKKHIKNFVSLDKYEQNNKVILEQINNLNKNNINLASNNIKDICNKFKNDSDNINKKLEELDTNYKNIKDKFDNFYLNYNSEINNIKLNNNNNKIIEIKLNNINNKNITIEQKLERY